MKQENTSSDSFRSASPGDFINRWLAEAGSSCAGGRQDARELFGSMWEAIASDADPQSLGGPRCSWRT